MNDKDDIDPNDVLGWITQHDVDDIDEFIGEMHWEQLKALRKQYGNKQEKVALGAGISVPQLSRIENGNYIPKREVAERLAIMYGAKSLQDLESKFIEKMREVDTQNQATLRQIHNIAVEPIKVGVKVGSPKITVERKRIPLYGIIDTSSVFPQEETVQMLTEEADLIPTPTMLAGIEDAYAMIAPNYHMHPRYGEGDTLYVHPGRRVKQGDDVVIRLDFGNREIAFIREIWKLKSQTQNTDSDYTSYELVSWAQRDFAKMKASADVGDYYQLADIVEAAASWLEKNVMSLLLFADGKAVLTGADQEVGKIVKATVDVIVGCQRKQGNEYGRGNYGTGPFGG